MRRDFVTCGRRTAGLDYGARSMASRETEINLPDDLTAGAYATWVGVWHTRYELVLDFGVSEREETDDDRVPIRVVSRVRVPVGFAFELLSHVSNGMIEHERIYGESRRPERRLAEEA